MSLEHPLESTWRTAAAGHVPFFAVCCVILEQILTPCSKHMAWVQDYPVRAQLYLRLLQQHAGCSFILFVLLFRGEAEFTRDGNITWSDN